MWLFRKSNRKNKDKSIEQNNEERTDKNTSRDEKLAEIARTSVDPKTYESAVQKIASQDLLFEIANDGAHYKESARLAAIKKITRPEAVLSIALKNINLENRYSIVADRACRRYLEIGRAENFFPIITKLSTDQDRIVAVAICCLKNNRDALRRALENTEDMELVNRMRCRMYWDKENQEICTVRANELAQKESSKLSRELSPEETAAFVKDESHTKEQRIAMIKEIKDDRILSDILLSFGKYEDQLLVETAGQISDPDILADTAEKLDDDRYRKIYTFLKEKCAKYTPEFIVMDTRTWEGYREEALDSVSDQSILKTVSKDPQYGRKVNLKAAIKLGDQDLLTELVLKYSDESLQKSAVSAITDPTLLRKIASECKDTRIRWCAAERLGDDALRGEIEALAKERVNGHIVYVTVNIAWEHYEEKCMRCGAVYGHRDDSESTRHYGKPFKSFPCRPDIEKL